MPLDEFMEEWFLVMKKPIRNNEVRILEKAGEEAESSLIIGARASLQAIYDAPAYQDLFHRTLGQSICWDERTTVTVDQVVHSPNLAPQWIAALLALGARVVISDEEGGSSILSEHLQHNIAERGKLVTLRLPIEVPGRLLGEAHLARTPGDEPIVAAIAAVDLVDNRVRQARLGLTGVWKEPVGLAQAARSLEGELLTKELIQQVSEEVKLEVNPVSDFRGSADYRREMSAVVARRALETCMKGVD